MRYRKPREKMTSWELEGMISFHESIAQMFDSMHEPNQANRTRELITKYRKELNVRGRPEDTTPPLLEGPR